MAKVTGKSGNPGKSDQSDQSDQSGKSASSIAQRLNKALAKVDRPDVFCTRGSLPAVLPGLEVKGVGPVGLPLTEPQLKALKSRAEQAPYGKGTETLVDTNVRRVWRLTPDRFSLTNPDWGAFLDGIVAKVQGGLGLEGQKLEAHLYDLLLYEAGSFFLPHRDGEKLDRMVATLVVALPSRFSGGQLIVRHEGQEQKIDFSGPECVFKVNYVAFYADCEHEVKPVKSGYRLCLVYNLTLAKAKKGLGAPRSGENVARVAKILGEWVGDEGAPPKLAVTLGHKYTKDGLTWDALKGVDRTKAHVLAEAAKQVGCRVYLAPLTFWESGSAEGEYDDYRYRRGYGRSRRYWDEEEDDEEEGEEGDEEAEDGGGVEGKYTMGEVFEASLSAEGWLAPDGSVPSFGSLPVEEEEIVPPESLRAVKPEEDYEGYTGNAGMTLQRWYRHGAVFVWPEDRDLDVLLQAGSRNALKALQGMITAWRSAEGAEAEALKKRCMTFARKILGGWPESQHQDPYLVWTPIKESDAWPDPMTSLKHLDDPELIGTYLGDTLIRDTSLIAGPAVVKAIVRHGWETFRGELLALFRATTSGSIERNARFLEHLCAAAGGPGADDDTTDVTSAGAGRSAGKKKRRASEDGAAREIRRSLAEMTVAALERFDSKRDPNDWRASRIYRGKLLPCLARALLSAGLQDLLSSLVDHVLKGPTQYPLRPIQLSALEELAPWLGKHRLPAPAAMSRWLASCRQQLEKMTAAEPQPPADWRRDAEFSTPNADYEALKQFLRDPRQREARFQMAQHRRSALENLIQYQHLDVSVATDRTPRPQVLVCTKNTASYERKLKQYQQDLKDLAAVRAMETTAAR